MGLQYSFSLIFFFPRIGMFQGLVTKVGPQRVQGPV